MVLKLKNNAESCRLIKGMGLEIPDNLFWFQSISGPSDIWVTFLNRESRLGYR